MATVGWINIGMSVSVGKLAKDLAGAGAQLRAFGATASTGIGRGLGGLASQLAGIGAPARAAAGLVSAGYVNIKAAATDAYQATVGLVASAMESIDAQAKLADRVGTSTENLIGLQHATRLAGVDTEGVSAALTKLGVNLANAAQGAGPAKDALRQLGLNAAELATADRVEAFGKIGDALNAVANPAQRAALSVELFGKQGAALAPLLAEGSAGIAAAVKESEELGLSFSRVDAAKVDAAGDTIDRLKALLAGVATQLAVNLAPYIEAIGNYLGEMGKAGLDGGNAISEGVAGVVEWVATLGGYFGYVVAAWYGFEAVALKGLSLVVRGFAHLSGALGFIGRQLGLVAGQFGTTAARWADELDKLAVNRGVAALDELAKPPPTEGLSKFFASIRDGAKSAADAATDTAGAIAGVSPEVADLSEKVGELEKNLRDQVETFGMTSRQTDLYKLAQAGASDEQLASARSLAMQLDEMERSKKAQEDLAGSAKQLIESSKTPLEKYQDELTKIRQLQSAGLIDDTTALAAANKASGELGKGQVEKFGGAFELGSKEARSTILAARTNGAAGADPSRDIARSSKDAASEAKAQTPLLAAIAGGIRAIAANATAAAVDLL